jgi:monofunctional biosynthetic peptidoglycan transglycosylase
MNVAPLLWRSLRNAAIILIVLILLPYLIAPFYRFVMPVSTPMLWRWLTGARVERIRTPLDQIGPVLPRTVIASEDGKFCTHHGVDLGELRAAFQESDDLSDMRGGSTISQQTAKNLFLWQGRSVVRKALELPLAMWLDLVLGKRRMMEIYLNVAEWGPNGEFGAEAGARRAFGKRTQNLSPGEAALLAAMLPNPHVRDARRPGPGLARVAGVYQARAARVRAIDACLVKR